MDKKNESKIITLSLRMVAMITAMVLVLNGCDKETNSDINSTNDSETTPNTSKITSTDTATDEATNSSTSTTESLTATHTTAPNEIIITTTVSEKPKVVSTTIAQKSKDKNVAKSSSTTTKANTAAILTQMTTTAKIVSTTPATTVNQIPVNERPPNAAEVKKGVQNRGFYRIWNLDLNDSMIIYSLDASDEQMIVNDFKKYVDIIKNYVNQGKYDMPMQLLGNFNLMVNYDFSTIFSGYGRQFRYFFESLSPKGQDTVISYFREAETFCKENISDFDARIQKEIDDNTRVYEYDFTHTPFSRISSSTR